jgi:hypothetical protein
MTENKKIDFYVNIMVLIDKLLKIQRKSEQIRDFWTDDFKKYFIMVVCKAYLFQEAMFFVITFNYQLPKVIIQVQNGN